MRCRRLGRTELRVSEIGFGGEWLERHEEADSIALVRYAGTKGVNLIDCWMPDPKSRDIIGKAIAPCRDRWIVQGHFGSTWQNGQYVRTRDMAFVRPAFEDQLARIGGGYIDLGMIHYVDEAAEWEALQHSAFLDYVKAQLRDGVIRHIGLSTHNPVVGKLAAESGLVEMILFSVNPAFDLMPPTEDLMRFFEDRYDDALAGVDPVRAEMYRVCACCDVGITCMKPYAGGRLFDAKRSPFGVALTPVQCIHYCLTKPAVASVLCGYDTREQLDAALAYETASDAEKDYATALAAAPKHAFGGGACAYCGHCQPCPAGIDIAMVNKLYDLAVMQDSVPVSLREHYNNLAHPAGACIGCHGCETRCPFGVKVAERMRSAAALFGA